MKIVLIAAVGQNGAIGNSKTGNMPWLIKEELRLFRKLTLHKAVVMGYKTALSVGPLPKRLNILHCDNGVDIRPIQGFTHMTKEEILSDALALPNDREIMIAGGAHVYRQYLHHADEAIISHINGHHAGDVFFPVDKLVKWKLAESIYMSSSFTTNRYVRVR